MSKQLNVSETPVTEMNVNIIGDEQQYIDHLQSVQPTDVTFLIENSLQYVQPARNEIIINKFPDQNAFDSQASNLTWSDLSVIYEDNDFVDKSNMFVYFYDYDGSIAYKYNIDEFFVLEELPPLPDHSDINKICDSWNWTLKEIRDYLEEYPADINVGCTVHCGSNPELGSSHVRFYNHEGVVLYDYTAAQFLALSELPALPDLSSINRVADGWNWTLAEISTYLHNVDGDVNVGYTMSPGNDPSNGSSVVRFIDYEGTVLYTYTAAQFLALSELPALPNRTSENLTCDGWNWTLTEITSHLNTVDGDVNVGAIYHTADDKTHITCKPTKSYPQATISLTPTVANAVTVDWGDGTTDTWTLVSQETKSHTYTGVTDSSVYDITISCSSGTYSFNGYFTGGTINNQNCIYTDIRLSNKVTSLGTYCFYNCSFLQSVTIPSGVTSLGTYCFSNCSSLQSVAIPSGVTRLGTYCFYGCYSLQSVAIPSGVTSLGDNCFQNCYSLQSVAIPSGVTSLSNSCFNSCYSLQSVAIPSGVTSLGNNCFQNCSSLQFVAIPSGVTSLNTSCFQNCFSLQSVEIPSGVTSLGNNCFQYCSSLQSVAIPSGVTSLGGNCFYGCSSLQSVTIPSGVTSLNTSCFQNCSSLQFVAIPSGVTSLNTSCFSNCSSLQSVTIPSGVTSLGNSCFQYCFSLKKIYCKPTTPPTLGNTNAIPNNTSLVIHVPTSTISAYQNASNWSAHSSKMVEYNSLANNTSITNLEINKKIIFDNIASYNLLDKNINVLKDTENNINDINFYDYDGKLLYSYSNNEFLNLENLPTLPDHTSENLTCDGWNWTLQHIASHISNVGGIVNVGANYHTTDGKTHITCKPTESFPQASICLTPTVANDVIVNWGDGTTDTWTTAAQETKSHTYIGVTEASVYDITIFCTSGTYSFNTYITGTQQNNINYVYTDIRLSNNVTRFGRNCFNECSYLQTLNISNSVTSLDDYCFQNCYSLQSVAIPSGVTSLGTYCFYGCSSLQSVVIPSGVTSLGGNCFQNCYSLQYVTMPSGVTSLSGNCFNSCYSLQSVAIPIGVTSLGSGCFLDCHSLQSVEIPNSVTSLGNNCFQNCSSLQSVAIPSGVTSLGNNCFYSCSSLQSITMSNNVTSLGSGCFLDCHSLQSVEISSGVTSLSGNCFGGCYSLQSVEIPSGVTSLGSGCFDSCYSLKSITIPNSVTSLNTSCFQNCYSLQSVEIPSGVTSLNTSCFQNCFSLQSVTIPDTITSLGNSCFGSCYSLQSVAIPIGVTSLGNNCFYCCYSLQSIAIPIGVTSLGTYCFYGCSSLQYVAMPNSVTSLGSSCFQNCSSLRSINIPSGVTSLSNSCFNGCYSLQSVAIPSGVTSLEQYCFSGCYSLQYVSMSNSVTSLGSSCFLNCSSLQKIYMEPTTPPTLGNTNAIPNNAKLVIYVPSGTLTAYQQATNWSSFASKIFEED